MILMKFLFFINKKTALHLAVELESIPIIKLLVDHKGININAENEI